MSTKENFKMGFKLILYLENRPLEESILKKALKKEKRLFEKGCKFG